MSIEFGGGPKPEQFYEGELNSLIGSWESYDTDGLMDKVIGKVHKNTDPEVARKEIVSLGNKLAEALEPEVDVPRILNEFIKSKPASKTDSPNKEAQEDDEEEDEKADDRTGWGSDEEE